VIVYGILFLGAVIVVVPWLAWQIDRYIPGLHFEIGWFRLPGAAFFLICFVIYIRSSYILTCLGKGAYVEFDPPTEFVATGPFRWVRNPIAACVVGMLLGEAIALSSTGVFLLFLASLILAHLQVVMLEEPLLEKRFGAAYRDYLNRVPRWIPRRPKSEANR